MSSEPTIGCLDSGHQRAGDRTRPKILERAFLHVTNLQEPYVHAETLQTAGTSPDAIVLSRMIATVSPAPRRLSHTKLGQTFHSSKSNHDVTIPLDRLCSRIHIELLRLQTPSLLYQRRAKAKQAADARFVARVRAFATYAYALLHRPSGEAHHHLHKARRRHFRMMDRCADDHRTHCTSRTCDVDMPVLFILPSALVLDPGVDQHSGTKSSIDI